MGLATELSVKEIQLIIHNEPFLVDKRSDLVVPNVSWGLLPYEADLLVVKPSGLCAEYEIKRSFEDFKKDFTKTHTHNADIIAYFYYVIPEKIKDKVLNYLRENINIGPMPAVLAFSEQGNLRRVDEGGKEKRANYRHITDAERAILARLISLRFWTDRNEFSTMGYSAKDKKIKDLKAEISVFRGKLKDLQGRVFNVWHRATDMLPTDERLVLVRTWRGFLYLAWYKKNEGFYTEGVEEPLLVHHWCEVPTYKDNDFYYLDFSKYK